MYDFLLLCILLSRVCSTIYSRQCLYIFLLYSCSFGRPNIHYLFSYFFLSWFVSMWISFLVLSSLISCFQHIHQSRICISFLSFNCSSRTNKLPNIHLPTSVSCGVISNPSFCFPDIKDEIVFILFSCTAHTYHKHLFLLFVFIAASFFVQYHYIFNGPRSSPKL